MNAISPNTESSSLPLMQRSLLRTSAMQRLFFHTVPPLMMALPLGWYGAGLGAELPFAGSLLLWVTICLMSWWLSDLCSALVAALLRPWRPPLWAILIGGYLINLAASSVYNPAVVAALVHSGLAPPTPAITQYFLVDRNLLDLHYLRQLFSRGIPGMLIWLAGNYLFERFTGITRFAQARGRPVSGMTSTLMPAPSQQLNAQIGDAGGALLAHSASSAAHAAAEQPIPRFFERLSKLRGLALAELVAVEAEDHYIQVHSTRGRELVYYRFGDALVDLNSLQGVQIHRSTWVSRVGIAKLEGTGRNLRVVLVTGEKLRVSLSNQGALRSAGWAN